MNIHLTPQTEAFIQQQISSGLYNSAGELVSEALRAMDIDNSVRENKLKKLRQDIKDGLESGEPKAWDAHGFKLLARKVKSGEVKIDEIS